MDELIHNAEEAVKACGSDLRWVSDSVASMITDFDTPFGVPPDNVIKRIIDETIWKIEEVPCGWCIFWGLPEFVKRMRGTGEPRDAPHVIGGWPYIVNRWTGKASSASDLGFPTWNAAVQNYIYHLPEDQHSACRLPQFSSVWQPDPIRFCPAKLSEVEVDKINDLKNIRFTLEVDEAGQNLLVGNMPYLTGMPPLRGGVPYVRVCSIIDVKKEGITKIYTLKPEFEEAKLRPHGNMSGRIIVATHECKTFPSGVWLYFQIQIGTRDF